MFSPIKISPLFNLPPSGGGGTPVEIGTVIDNDFSSGSWTYFGTGSAVFNPTNITLSGGDSPFPGAYTLGLKSNLVTSCENSQVVIEVEMASDSRCGCGFLGLTQGSPYSMMLTAGGQFINFLDDTFVNNSFPTLLTWVAGDVLKFTTNRSYNQIQVIVENLTDPDTITLTHNITNVYGDPAADRAYSGASQIYINNWAGTNKITSIQYSSTDWKYADVIFVGTSKTAGFYAGTKADRFSDLYATATGKDCNNWATSSGTTATVLLQIPEIIDMAPTAVCLEIGCNDVRNGVLQATIESNINSIISQLTTAGITVYIQESFPETVLDQTALNAFLATLPNFIPATGFNTGTMLNADGVHVNSVGASWISTNIQSYIP